MDIESLIASYGYLAVAIGTFLEGETVLALGGFFAQRGYLVLHWVIACAFIGTLLGDQVFFWLGRTQGHALLDRRESWRCRGERVLFHVHRHQVLLILGYRLLYGLRSVTPFVIGMSGVSPWHFLFFDAIGVAIWAIVVGILGYVFASTVDALVDDIDEIEQWIIGGIIVIGLVAWGIRRWRMRAAASN